MFNPTVRIKPGARNLVLAVHSTVLYIVTFTDIDVLIICFVRIEHAFVTSLFVVIQLGSIIRMSNYEKTNITYIYIYIFVITNDKFQGM